MINVAPRQIFVMKKSKQNNSLPQGFMPPHILSEMPQSTPILVAFSGGADSHTLLHILLEYSRSSGARIYAAHLNHGIRGDEADSDEQFCKETASAYNIEFFSEKVNIPQIAKELGKSIELAARDARYAFFARIMKEHGIPLLAVAHNANDNLETVLYNITRGASLNGLCGIPMTRKCEGGMLIRPILAMNRDDIVSYCDQNKLTYVTDSTNTDTEYARNRIRSNVIPELTVLNPSVEKNVLSQSHQLRSDAELLDSLTNEFLSKELCPNGALPLKAANSAHPSILSRAVIKLYEKNGGSSLEHRHIEAIIALCKRGEPHARLSLPCSLYATIENDTLCFTSSPMINTVSEPYFAELYDGNNYISQINCEIVIGQTQKPINIYKKSIKFGIDSAKINGALYARPRCEGDKILVGNMHKSVKKLLCDKKIPLDIRSRLPMICDDDGIVAIPFVAMTEKCNQKNQCSNIKILHFYLY